MSRVTSLFCRALSMCGFYGVDIWMRISVATKILLPYRGNETQADKSSIPLRSWSGLFLRSIPNHTTHLPDNMEAINKVDSLLYGLAIFTMLTHENTNVFYTSTIHTVLILKHSFFKPANERVVPEAWDLNTKDKISIRKIVFMSVGLN